MASSIGSIGKSEPLVSWGREVCGGGLVGNAAGSGLGVVAGGTWVALAPPVDDGSASTSSVSQKRCLSSRVAAGLSCWQTASNSGVYGRCTTSGPSFWARSSSNWSGSRLLLIANTRRFFTERIIQWVPRRLNPLQSSTAFDNCGSSPTFLQDAIRLHSFASNWLARLVELWRTGGPRVRHTDAPDNRPAAENEAQAPWKGLF